jgi:DNA helicase-2/ATP-dependent DNA helicase PcrA
VNDKKQSIKSVINKFDTLIKRQHLAKKDLDFCIKKGEDILKTYLDQKYDTFNQNQQTELGFSGQQSMIGDAHITGKLDLIEIDKKNKTITVTDYKTGKPAESWQGQTDFEKIKLHKYKQQLLFYKLLIENSRDYYNYNVGRGIMQFVEPTKDGRIADIEIVFKDEDIKNFKKLINAIWVHVINLDFPDISGYSQNYKGILDFEQDLIENRI